MQPRNFCNAFWCSHLVAWAVILSLFVANSRTPEFLFDLLLMLNLRGRLVRMNGPTRGTAGRVLDSCFPSP
jgi:hypothetical protein